MFARKLLPLVLSFILSVTFADGGSFGGWAARGIVVKKEFRSTALPRSAGIDGIYRLLLRGEDQKLRRQMVTRELFLAYEVGDRLMSTRARPPWHAGALRALQNRTRARR